MLNLNAPCSQSPYDSLCNGYGQALNYVIKQKTKITKRYPRPVITSIGAPVPTLPACTPGASTNDLSIPDFPLQLTCVDAATTFNSASSYVSPAGGTHQYEFSQQVTEKIPLLKGSFKTVVVSPTLHIDGGRGPGWVAAANPVVPQPWVTFLGSDPNGLIYYGVATNNGTHDCPIAVRVLDSGGTIVMSQYVEDAIGNTMYLSPGQSAVWRVSTYGTPPTGPFSATRDDSVGSC